MTFIWLQCKKSWIGIFFCYVIISSQAMQAKAKLQFYRLWRSDKIFILSEQLFQSSTKYAVSNRPPERFLIWETNFMMWACQGCIRFRHKWKGTLWRYGSLTLGNDLGHGYKKPTFEHALVVVHPVDPPSSPIVDTPWLIWHLLLKATKAHH